MLIMLITIMILRALPYTMTYLVLLIIIEEIILHLHKYLLVTN